jgi:hypothetical protein
MKQLLFMLIVLMLISCTRETPYPTLGRDSLKVEEVETLQEGLKGLGTSGVRGAALVLLFSRDGFFDAENRAEIARKVDAGIVSRVIWAIPGPVVTDFVQAEDQLKEYAISLDTLPVAEVEEMKYNEGCLIGRISKASMYLCNMANIPFLREPVLLSAESGYFVEFADLRSANKLSAVLFSFRSVFKRKYSVAEAVFSYGVMDGFTRPIHRYVGETAAMVIASPAVLSLKLPDIWSARDSTEILFVEKDYDRLSGHVRDALAKYPGDPAISLINAAAMLRQGEGLEDVIAEAEALCLREPVYCIGLQYLGYLARLDGRDDIAGAFDERALKYTKLPDRLYYGRRAGEGAQKETGSN